VGGLRRKKSVEASNTHEGGKKSKWGAQRGIKLSSQTRSIKEAGPLREISKSVTLTRRGSDLGYCAFEEV